MMLKINFLLARGKNNLFLWNVKEADVIWQCATGTYGCPDGGVAPSQQDKAGFLMCRCNWFSFTVGETPLVTIRPHSKDTLVIDRA